MMPVIMMTVTMIMMTMRRVVMVLVIRLGRVSAVACRIAGG